MKPRSVMMYGESGTTKTSQCYHMVRWILSKPENQGKRFRLIASDGGGYAPFIDSGMVEKGMVEIFDYSTSVLALSDNRKLSQGYWPRLTTDGGQYFQKDEKCKTTSEQYSKIAGYIIEGMASYCEVLKTHCSNQPEGVGWKESIHFEEDGEHISGLAQGHYNLIQKEMYSAHMKGYNNLPVEWLIYTSLVGKGEDKQSRETVYGPQVVGNASTAQVPSWFMDCLHLAKARYKVKDQEVEGMVAWFIRHNDEQTNVPYLCKARILPEMYPDLLATFPNGFVPLGFKKGVDVYFRALEILRKKHMEGEVKE